MILRTTCRLSGLSTAVLAAALLGACNKVPTSPPLAPAAPTTMGTQMDDTAITSNVKAALMADAAIKGMDIGVATRNGEVQLSGMVANQGQIDQVIQVATSIAGANFVKNALRIKP